MPGVPNQGGLFDLPVAPYGGKAPHNSTGTSKVASASIQAVLTSMQSKVLRFVASRGAEGSTCDEAEEALGMKHQTCSARIRELTLTERLLLIEVRKKPDGSPVYLTRKTRSGRPARVYVVPDHHPEIV